MNSFSERSYKAALLKKKDKLSSEQGSDSKTKREVAAALSAPLTAPTVQRLLPPTPIVIESSPSDAFTTPKSNSRENSREKRARALTMSSPPKKLDLPKAESRILKEAIKQRKEEKEGTSSAHPVCVDDDQDAGQQQPKLPKKNKKQVSAVEESAVKIKNKKQVSAVEESAVKTKNQKQVSAVKKAASAVRKQTHQKQEAGSPSKAHIMATIQRNKRGQEENGQQQDENEEEEERSEQEADEDENEDEQEHEEADEDADKYEQEHEEAEEDEDEDEQEHEEAEEDAEKYEQEHEEAEEDEDEDGQEHEEADEDEDKYEQEQEEVQ